MNSILHSRQGGPGMTTPLPAFMRMKLPAYFATASTFRVRRRIHSHAATIRPVWFAVLWLLLSTGLNIPAMADGCFVFRWDKQTDIQEPNQKAIIVYDAGREDLLLQVKYEGRVEDFGWLIPVPSLPTVEKGSMKAFYELSQLTQRMDESRMVRYLGGEGSARESADTVKVIEVKTVGAYEVAVLSARDANSLSGWLQSHAYAIPNGKAEIIDEYIRNGWYFIACKIQLNGGVGFRLASGAAAKGTSGPNPAKRSVQRQLASGELHPLLISFETPHCVYPLRISAIGAKPSEVSLYVLSGEPLLNRFIFEKGHAKLHQRGVEWEQKSEERRTAVWRSYQDTSRGMLSSSLNQQVRSPDSRGESVWDGPTEDLEAIIRETPPARDVPSADRFNVGLAELLECYHVRPKEIPRAGKAMPRLKNKSWYLTKQVWAFAPDEMDDLVFQPAVPILTAVLSEPEGRAAAHILHRFGTNTLPLLLAACESTNARARLNASEALLGVGDPRVSPVLLNLLSDAVPAVRRNAKRAIEASWAPGYVDPLISRFRDPDPGVRALAVGLLLSREVANSAPRYLQLLRDPDPNVRGCAYQVLATVNPAVVPREELLQWLRSPDPEVQARALGVLASLGPTAVPRAELLRLLSSPTVDTVRLALDLLRQQPPTGQIAQPAAKQRRLKRPSQAPPRYRLTSAEAAPLTTNRFIMPRLSGLWILQENADADAVELALPMLRDTNSIVRSRAFAFFRNVSGEDLSRDDPVKWEQWWAANKAAFTSRKSARP